MVGFPYTKFLNAMIFTNQSAAVILTSEDKARALGVPEDKWVYLHGYADANDIWNVSERENFHSSPAMRYCADTAFQMAGVAAKDIQHFDIYSCFPSAVQIACDEIGIPHDDPRDLSLTGGLPYFGGPGNNYCMHAIAAMVHRLRENPGDFGMLNANGWFITKHSMGIYSTQPTGTEHFTSSTIKAKEMSSELAPDTIKNPEGEATIETFTVLFDQSNKPSRGIVIGRDGDNRRFISNTPRDSDMLLSLCDGQAIGRKGKVSSSGKGMNTFSL